MAVTEYIVEPKSKNASFEAASLALASAHRVLVVAGESALADGTSGALVLGRVLQAQGKEVTIAVEASGGALYTWLPGSEVIETSLLSGGDFVIRLRTDDATVDRIKYTLDDGSVDIFITPKTGQFTPEQVSFSGTQEPYDLIVTVQADRLESLGNLWLEAPTLFQQSPLLTFGTHLTHTQYGEINVVEPRQASASELIYSFLLQDPALDAHIEEDDTTILLAGITSATGSFLEKKVPPSTFFAAGHLLEEGADHPFVVEKLYKSKSLDTLLLWGEILATLELDRFHQIMWSRVTHSTFEQMGIGPEDVQDISDVLLRHVVGAEVGVLFIERKDGTEIQVRASDQGHLFEALREGDEYQTNPVPHGVNLFVSGKNIPEVQPSFLNSLVRFQKQRHDLPDDVPLTRANVRAEAGIAKEKTEKKKRIRTAKPVDWSSASLPFQAPEKN